MKHAVIYKGPSLLDNEQIVVIATYSDRNTKTGKVVQTYILREILIKKHKLKAVEAYVYFSKFEVKYGKRKP